MVNATCSEQLIFISRDGGQSMSFRVGDLNTAGMSAETLSLATDHRLDAQPLIHPGKPIIRTQYKISIQSLKL